MKVLNAILRDFFKCLIWGTIISLGIFIVIGIIALLANKFDIVKSLSIIRSALLIIGPLGMALGAFLILKKRTEKEFEFIEDWKEKYSVFSYRLVVILVSIIITLYGSIIDKLIFNL